MRAARRCSAYLRLYGPRDAREYARLMFGPAPPDTPAGFHDELQRERMYDTCAKDYGGGVYMSISFTNE